MKYLFFALLFSASVATANAKSTPTTTPRRASDGINKYEIRQLRVMGALTASEAREIRAHKRQVLRSENRVLKANAALWVRA